MKNILKSMAAIALLTASSTFAGPVAQIKGGLTTIILSEDIQALLASCEVERIKPAVQRPDGSRWRFWVTGGVLDLETYVGELEHGGGMQISCGDQPGGTASIQNLRAEYINEVLVLTGVVVVGDEPLQRVPLFAPGGDAIETSVSNGGTIRLAGIELRLTQAAADFLNALLATDVFTAETVIGEAISRIKVLPSATGNRGKGKDKGEEEPAETEDD